MEKEKLQTCGPKESGEWAEVEKMVTIWFGQPYGGVMTLKKYAF